MRSEIIYSEDCNCVTVTGIPTFRIKITHNKLSDELYRPRLLSFRASHNMIFVALSWLFTGTPWFELLASCNICNLHCSIIIHRDNTVVKKLVCLSGIHIHTMRIYIHSSGRKFSRFFNIGCSRRCAVSLTPLAFSRPGRQFSDRIVLDMVKTKISDTCLEIKPESPAHSPSCFSSTVLPDA